MPSWAAPPSKVPTDQPMATQRGLTPATYRPMPTTIDTTLNMAGASAGAA
jgi:hypothetical protein